MIYLDNAATTPISTSVLEAMMPYLMTSCGNPYSIHTAGRNAKAAVENARAQVAAFLNASPEQIIFTSGGSEANSLAITGVLPYLKNIGKPCIVLSATEHPSVISASTSGYAETMGFSHAFIQPNDNGEIRPKSVRSVLEERKDVGLVSVMFINNEVGTVNDVFEIAQICREKGVLFHTDCVQAAAEIESLDVKMIGCDFMSISSHKICGPKGVGALYVKDKSLLTPIISGSDAQESGLRGGTPDVAGIVGFGKACELMMQNDYRYTKPFELKMDFFRRIIGQMERIEQRMFYNGQNPYGGGRILNLGFPGIDAQTLVLTLSSLGVCISAGSACNGEINKPSRTLTAMGLSEEDALSSVRISFSHNNTEAEIEQAVRDFVRAIQTLKNK